MSHTATFHSVLRTFSVRLQVLFVLVLPLFSATSLFAQAASAGRVAALEQDMVAIREEIQKLREEVQDLKTENNNLRAQIRAGVPGAASSISALQRQIASESAARASADQALEARVEKKLASTIAAVNQALKAVSQTPSPEPKGGGTRPGNNSTDPVAPPADMPKTAVEHVIQKGDNPDKLAARYKSKTSWILAANPGLNPRNLVIGKKVLIPVANREPEAQPPSQ